MTKTRTIPPIIVSLLVVAHPEPTLAQDESDPATATAAAEDAFGERVGVESIGLYNPNQSRGFDLQAASGASRLEGAYFFPSAGLGESLLSGSSIRVGISATRLDLPSPSGVIAYRLREPTGSGGFQVETGLRARVSPMLAVQGDFALGGDSAMVLHGLAMPKDRGHTGEPGERYGTAAVVRLDLSTGFDLHAFAGWEQSRYQGSTAVIGEGDAAPPPLDRDERYSPDWLRSRDRGLNAGVVARWRRGPWEVDGSLIRSHSWAERTEFALLRIDPEGAIASTVYRLPQSSARSDVWEARLARTFALLGAEHRIGLAARGRGTRAERGEAEELDGGRFTVDNPNPAAGLPMPRAEGRRGYDSIDQRIYSLTYGLDLPAVQVRLGAHANRHEQTAVGFEGLTAEQEESSWMASASVAVAASPRLRLFASYVSGLEESGTAPDAARNRGEVLAPVKAEQYELGAVYRLHAEFNLIASAFRIEKPTHGLLPDGDYSLTGTVRHSGLEISLTGQLSPSTRILFGANLVEPRQEGALVDAGTVMPVAPGVSRINAVAAIEHALGDALSVDASLLYEGDRRRDSTSSVEIAGVPVLDLGLRYVARLSGNDLTIRARVFNALGRNGYWATTGGPLVPLHPRSWQLTAAIDF